MSAAVRELTREYERKVSIKNERFVCATSLTRIPAETRHCAEAVIEDRGAIYARAETAQQVVLDRLSSGALTIGCLVFDPDMLLPGGEPFAPGDPHTTFTWKVLECMPYGSTLCIAPDVVLRARTYPRSCKTIEVLRTLEPKFDLVYRGDMDIFTKDIITRMCAGLPSLTVSCPHADHDAFLDYMRMPAEQQQRITIAEVLVEAEIANWPWDHIPPTVGKVRIAATAHRLGQSTVHDQYDALANAARRSPDTEFYVSFGVLLPNEACGPIPSNIQCTSFATPVSALLHIARSPLASADTFELVGAWALVGKGQADIACAFVQCQFRKHTCYAFESREDIDEFKRLIADVPRERPILVGLRASPNSSGVKHDEWIPANVPNA